MLVLIPVVQFQSSNHIATDSETKLNRFFLSYAGSNLPSPDADPEFTATKDYTVQRYVETQIYSGTYYNSGVEYVFNPIVFSGTS